MHVYQIHVKRGKDAFKCVLCDDEDEEGELNGLNAFKAHIVDKHGVEFWEKNYNLGFTNVHKCDLCDFTTNRPSSVKRHKIRNHPKKELISTVKRENALLKSEEMDIIEVEGEGNEAKLEDVKDPLLIPIA